MSHRLKKVPDRSSNVQAPNRHAGWIPAKPVLSEKPKDISLGMNRSFDRSENTESMTPCVVTPD